jgi:hypothetical protein
VEHNSILSAINGRDKWEGIDAQGAKDKGCVLMPLLGINIPNNGIGKLPRQLTRRPGTDGQKVARDSAGFHPAD